ncbi:MAG TPA: hypothetical protein VGF56_03930 [Rhizomicrobium sp.]|jgi:hypothetical protein
MQIGSSTNSLLIAAQQAKQAPRPPVKPEPQAPKAEAFEPLPLKQTAAPTAHAAQPPAGPLQRPGSRLDIKV